MTDRPILFSAPMIRAILDGRKTQTRRVLKPQPYENDEGLWVFTFNDSFIQCDHPSETPLFAHQLPFSAGDRLWVREHWKAAAAYDDLAPSEMGGEEALKYLSDNFIESWGWTYDPRWGRHRQAMHMPRWASRLTLIVEDVRVQRLQEISYLDTQAEGVEATDIWARRQKACVDEHIECGSVCRDSFAELWDGLNAERGFGWDANPWVVAITFRTIKENIDSERLQ